MSATNTFEGEIAALIFNGTAIPNIADNAASSPITTYYISLHTADPGEGGSQNTSETAYTGYSRQTVARNSGGWTLSGGSATNAAQLNFGVCTASPGNDITYVGIGLSSSGAGTLKASLQLANPIVMAVGATPIFPIGNLNPTVE